MSKIRKMLNMRNVFISGVLLILVTGGCYSALTVRSLFCLLGCGGFFPRSFEPVLLPSASPAFEKLPLMNKYFNGDDSTVACFSMKRSSFERWDVKDENEFIKSVGSSQGDLNKATQVLSAAYKFNWNDGVNDLYKDFPLESLVNWWGPTVNFRQVRECSDLLSCMARLAAVRGYRTKAINLLRTNVALVRQLISYRNGRGGLVLIDSMIALSMLSNTGKVLTLTNNLGLGDKTKTAHSSQKRIHITSLMALLEDVNDLSHLVSKGMANEKTGIKAFFKLCQDGETHKYGSSQIDYQAPWLNELMEFYYPDSSIYDKSYRTFKASNRKYVQRYENLAHMVESPWFILDALKDPFRGGTLFILNIMIPNVERAYERECELRAQIRRKYVCLAGERYRVDRNVPPESLCQLLPQIREELTMNPVTGSKFKMVRGILSQ